MQSGAVDAAPLQFYSGNKHCVIIRSIGAWRATYLQKKKTSQVFTDLKLFTIWQENFIHR